MLFAGVLSVQALGLAGCGDPFRSVAELDENPQVLAVAAEPPEVAPGEEVRLEALVHWPAGTPTLVWLVCIPRLGQSFITCLQGEMEELQEPPLCSQAPDARFCVAGVGSSATYRVAQGFFPDDGEAHTFFVNLLVSGDLDGLAACAETLAGGTPTGDCLLTLKRVVVTHGEHRNVNPVVSHLTLDGLALAPGVVALVEPGAEALEDLRLKVGVVVDPGTVDELFPPGEAPRSHTLVASWFTDCGSLGVEKSFLPCVPEGVEGGPSCEIPEVRWKPEISGLCRLHAVVRDGAGGTGWITQEVELR